MKQSGRHTAQRTALLLGAAATILLVGAADAAAQAAIENSLIASGGDQQQGPYGELYSTIGQSVITLDSLKGRDDETTWTGFWRTQSLDPVTEIRENRFDVFNEATGIAAISPNPFATSATIELMLARSGRVELAVYDLTGREVCRLVEGAREAGTLVVEWRPSGLDAGSYLLRLRVDGVEYPSRPVHYVN